MAMDRARSRRLRPFHARNLLMSTVGILIIDDDPEFRETFREALQLAGFEVVEAENGAAALAALERHAIGLVITDILMPGMDGIDVIHTIRQRSPALKVIAISGGNGRRGVPSLTMASQMGADRVLKKPFGARELVAAVEELLELPPDRAD